MVWDSIHLGRHSRELVEYVSEHTEGLKRVPTALFQVSLTSANPDTAHTATAQALVQLLCEQTGFDPDLVAMFAWQRLLHALRVAQASRHACDRGARRLRH